MSPPMTEPFVTCRESLLQTPGLGPICNYMTTTCRLSQVLKDPIQPKIRKMGGRGAASKQKASRAKFMATLFTLTFTAQPGEECRVVLPKSGVVRSSELFGARKSGKVQPGRRGLTGSQTLSCPGSGSQPCPQPTAGLASLPAQSQQN